MKYDLLIVLPLALGDVVAISNIINYFLRQQGKVVLFTENQQTLYDDYDNLRIVHDVGSLKGMRFEYLLDMQALPVHRALVRKAQAKIKIGGRRKNIWNRVLFDKRVSRFMYQNIYEDTLAFADALGIPGDEATDWSIKSYDFSFPLASGEVVIHADASNKLRYIPQFLLREILSYLIQNEVPVRIVGQDMETINSYLRDYPTLRYDRLSLTSLKSVLNRSALVIAPDSGIAHLASALDRKLIALYGPNLSKFSGPRKYTLLIEKDFSCRPCDQTKPCAYGLRCLNSIGFQEIKPMIDQVLNLGRTPA